MNSEYTGLTYDSIETVQVQTLISEIALTHAVDYESSAIIPYTQLHRPTQQELKPFLATDSTPTSGLIELVRPTAQLLEHIAQKTQRLAPTICEPNQPTTTCNTENRNLRPGLHIDSKENRPISTRMQSERRIGFNRGPGARFLLLGSVNVFDIAECMALPPGHAPNTGDIREYASLSLAGEVPPLHCLWLLLKPGMAYIAPTENVIHDGSTLGSRLGSTIDFWIGAPEQRSDSSAI